VRAYSDRPARTSRYEGEEKPKRDGEFAVRGAMGDDPKGIINTEMTKQERGGVFGGGVQVVRERCGRMYRVRKEEKIRKSCEYVNF